MSPGFLAVPTGFLSRRFTFFPRASPSFIHPEKKRASALSNVPVSVSGAAVGWATHTGQCPRSEGGKQGFRTGSVDVDYRRGRASGICAPHRATVRWTAAVMTDWRVPPSAGTAATQPPQLSCLPVFQEKPEIPIFMCNFSIFKHSAGQTKHSHWF